MILYSINIRYHFYLNITPNNIFNNNVLIHILIYYKLFKTLNPNIMNVFTNPFLFRK